MAFEILKFNEYKGNGDYDRGVLSIELFKWSEFYDEVSRFQNYRDYVWRGQRRGDDEWTLKSKFDRGNNRGNNRIDREKLLKRHLNQFRKAIKGRRGTNPPKLVHCS